MGGFDRVLDSFPSWMWGTVPQWGLFFLLLIAVVKTSPQWLTTWVTLRLARSNKNANRISELEGLVKTGRAECDAAIMKCRADCDEETGVLRKELQGIKEQRLAEQGAIMRAIVRMSDDPAVKKQLQLLEAMEQGLQSAHVLQSHDGNVIPKSNGGSSDE